MDEDALQGSIEQYKQQLNHIEALIESNVHDSKNLDDLNSLKKDLVEIIQTTEESLLCLKKSKLLQLLDEEISDFEKADNHREEIIQQSPDPLLSTLSHKKEIEDAIIGTQCRAPYTFEWGVTGYYNAMVLNIAEINDDTEEIKVAVLFINPTHRSMVPCPYFLDGKCRFEDDACRFSHGCVVNMDELKAYEDPDFSLLKVDDKCLAKYEDGVWYKATILSITKDEVSIHYDTYNVDETVKLEDVLPIAGNTPIDESDLSDNESEPIAGDEEKVIAEFCQRNTENAGVLGEWEKHTKGIASILMAKMGYVVGKGLGRNSDGRVEPVEIILLPTGKSLDACAELREKKKLKEPFKKKTKNNSNTAKQASGLNVFEFINNKLGGRKGDIEHLKHHDQFQTLDRRKPGKQNERNYNIELCKIEQEKSRIQKQIKKQKDSISRNSGKEFAIVQQGKQKVEAMQQQLQHLERQETMIKQKIHQKSEHKKLTVF